jgi:S1-C subfamily serine protease
MAASLATVLFGTLTAVAQLPEAKSEEPEKEQPVGEVSAERAPQRPFDLLNNDRLASVSRNSCSAIVHVSVVTAQPPRMALAGAEARPTAAKSGGTGVVIGANGLILTSAHVVRDAADIRVMLPNGRWRPVKRVAMDGQFDLALLRIDAHDLAALYPATSQVQLGTAVVALGRPAPEAPGTGRPGSVTNPCASLQNELDPTRTCRYDQLIESTTALDPGFSGGPLLDANGRLIGLNIGVCGSNATRRGYALPFTLSVRQAVAHLAEQTAD